MYHLYPSKLTIFILITIFGFISQLGIQMLNNYYAKLGK